MIKPADVPRTYCLLCGSLEYVPQSRKDKSLEIKSQSLTILYTLQLQVFSGKYKYRVHLRQDTRHQKAQFV